jgi:hypothetical protein
MLVQDVVVKVRETYRDPYSMEVGQTLWIGVDVGDRPSYGKKASNITFKPVILSPVSKDDLRLMGNGHTRREVREQQIARLFQEAYDQGAVLTNVDVGMLVGVSPATIGKQVHEWMEREGKVLPTRGIVHDLGPTMTHKRIIIKRYLEGHLVPEVARMTNHSEEAVERYLKAFRKVRMLKDRLDSTKDIARTLEMSEHLVKEYLRILEEYEGGGIDT